MSNVLLDTNVILRYLLKDHTSLFEQAKILVDPIKNAQTNGYIIEGVLVECVYVLLKVYAIPRNEIAEALIGLLKYPEIINKDKVQMIESLKLFSMHNIDIVDALLHTTA